MISKKNGPRPGEGNAASNLREIGSYLRATELQVPGYRFASGWVRTAEGFSSSYWHSLVDVAGPRVGAIIRQSIEVDLRLAASDFPSRETWNLVALLYGFSECGIVPTSEGILAATRSAGINLPIGGGDPKRELETLLWRESSAALLLHHARQLQRFARRAAQFHRLWWRLCGLIDLSAPSAVKSMAEIQARPRFSGRALAAVLGGANHE